MDSHDKRKTNPFLRTFSYAFSGIGLALRTERNMRIHLISSVVVIVVSYFLSITKTEWLFIFFAIGGMFALELANTAIERVVDLVTEEYHQLAKQAKDIAAGAVLVYAIMSVVIGIFIFIPYLLRLFSLN